MKEKILLIKKHLKQGTFKKMWTQTVWIYQYGQGCCQQVCVINTAPRRIHQHRQSQISRAKQQGKNSHTQAD